MRVAVIGAGIAGLGTAAGLHDAGAQVTVLERCPALRPGGSGLSLFRNGRTALEALGLGTAFDALVSEDAGWLRGGMRRADGSWLTALPVEAVRDVRVIHREDLHTLLSERLDPGTLHTGVTVTSVAVTGEVGWRTGEGSEHEERFDLVVGADGLRSTVRDLWPGTPSVSHAGYGAWRAITDRPVELGGEAGETLHAHRRFGIAPLADGRIYWFAVDRSAGNAPGTDDLRTVTDRFGTWHDPIPEILAATDPSAVHWLDIHELRTRLASYRFGRAVLVGDAAHAMTPNLGQGGNLALEDAATLVTLLRGLTRQEAPDSESVDAALATYDRLRRARTQRIALQSRLIGKVANVRGTAVSSTRDIVMSLMPSAVLRRQLETIHAWEPPTGAAR